MNAVRFGSRSRSRSILCTHPPCIHPSRSIQSIHPHFPHLPHVRTHARIHATRNIHPSPVPSFSLHIHLRFSRAQRDASASASASASACSFSSSLPYGSALLCSARLGSARLATGTRVQGKRARFDSKRCVQVNLGWVHTFPLLWYLVQSGLGTRDSGLGDVGMRDVGIDTEPSGVVQLWSGGISSLSQRAAYSVQP